MKKTRPGRLTAAALSLAISAAPPGFAQEGTGIRGNLSFSTGLEISDNPSLVSNPDGTTLTSVTNLGFSLSSETRVDQLRVNLGFGIEGEDGGGTTSADALDIRRTNFGATYVRSGITSRLSLSANYDEASLEDDVFGFFIDGVFDPDALIVDGGTRERTRLSAAFSTGLDAPFGMDLSISTTTNDYVDTTDPDLVNSDSTSLGAAARFQINPSTSARVFANLRTTDLEDGSDTTRESQAIGASVSTETRGGLQVSAGLSIDESETLAGPATVSSTDGLGLSFGIVQARPDGQVEFNLSSRVDEAGRRNSVSVSRDFDLPEGALTLSLGLFDQENEDPKLTTRVVYQRESANGTLTANLVQSPSTNDGSAFLNTSLALGYDAPINSVSSWGARFSYGASEAVGSSGADKSASASVRYSRDLNEDWNVNAGLRHRRVDESGAASRTSNTLFVNVGRDFSFGF